MKSWGGHHIILALPLAYFAGPLANMLWWFGKETGEATERAGGSKQALTTFTMKTKNNPKGVWEPWDFITPSIAGYLFDAVIRPFFSF